MADIVRTYTALSPSSPRSQVSQVLRLIIDAPPLTIEQTFRAELIQLLLKDLKSVGSKSRITNKDAAQATLALKTLGKTLRGADHLATAQGLSTLLSIATTFKEDHEAKCEALRCIANVLFLDSQARTTFVSKSVGGGEIIVSMLNKAVDPDQIFITSRILFLATIPRSSFILSLVEDKHHGRTVIDTISTKLDSTMVSLLSGAKSSREAMTDLLKFTFNILLHYPKMVHRSEGRTDDWSSKLDDILPPLLRVYSSLPPTFPTPLIAPLTVTIHCLITIPVPRSLRPVWFGAANSRPTSRSSTNGTQPVMSTHSRPVSTYTPAPSSSKSQALLAPIASRHSISYDSSHQSNSSSKRDITPPKPPKTFDRALSVLSAGRRLSRSPSPCPPRESKGVIQRTLDLLEVSFAYYFPDNVSPDSSLVREQAKTEHPDSNGDLGEVLSPLVVLCTRLCRADVYTRKYVCDWFIPAHLDRSKNLDELPDLLGKCLRLMRSVYHKRLKESVGEMLYAMCGDDAWVLSSKVGWGNVAGFLFGKGIMSAPPPPASSSSSSSFEMINPITGTVEVNGGGSNPAEEMTEEEKEAEMEKLFVLFDRLERSGGVNPSQNPVRKAIQQTVSS